MEPPKRPFQMPNIGDVRSEVPVFIPWRFFIFSLSLVVAVLAINFFIVFVYQPAFTANERDVKKQIDDKQIAFEQTDKQKISSIYSKLYFLNTDLPKHLMASPLFIFLEKSTLPPVVFNTLSFNVDKLSLALGGSADSLQTLVKQVFIFESAKEISGVSLSGATLNKQSSRFDFTLTLALKKDFLVFKIK